VKFERRRAIMKYNKSTVNKIIAALADGQGRVAAEGGGDLLSSLLCVAGEI